MKINKNDGTIESIGPKEQDLLDVFLKEIEKKCKKNEPLEISRKDFIDAVRNADIRALKKPDDPVPINEIASFLRSLKKENVCSNPARGVWRLENLSLLESLEESSGKINRKEMDNRTSSSRNLDNKQKQEQHANDRKRLAKECKKIKNRQEAKKKQEISDSDFQAISSEPEYVGEYEGMAKLRQHIERERNLKNREACIEFYKNKNDGTIKCEICEFDFTAAYGKRAINKSGETYIEVHHKVPLSETGKKRIVPSKDLCPVCSNCHAMLHRGPLLTIEELRKIVEIGEYGMRTPVGLFD